MQELLRRLLCLPDEATPAARQIDRFHFFIIGVTFAGALTVGLVTLLFIVRYRARQESAPTPIVTVSRFVEVSVTLGLLSLFIIWWVIGFRQYVALRTPPARAEDIYVTGKQWMWKFSRTDGQATAGVLVVQQERPVRLILTSRDVVHSFFVPAFRIKQDAVPGRYTTLWFKADRVGTYPVYCAEYCGVDHSLMSAHVVVLSPGDYARWLAGDAPDAVAHTSLQTAPTDAARGDTLTSMIDQGRNAASRYGCLSCHTTDGQRHIGPSFQGLYAQTISLTDGTRVLADEDYLTRSMMEPRSQIVSGFSALMPVYQGVLPQPEAAAIVEFIKSLRFASQEPPVLLPRFVAAPETAPPAPSLPGPAPVMPGNGAERNPEDGR
jgi:cytochrome c oxidase subunit 2